MKKRQRRQIILIRKIRKRIKKNRSPRSKGKSNKKESVIDDRESETE
jgi:hypothetical protein